MLRKTLIAALLALLAVGAGGPAKANPVFLEPYPDIFQARTFLASPTDPRPKDALQQQKSKKENPTSRIVADAFARDSSTFFLVGGGLGYANAAVPGHPWSLNANFFDTQIDHTNIDEFGFDVNGKLVIWQPKKGLPVTSIVGRYQEFNNLYKRWDALLAMDQAVTKDLYLTANLGYGRVDFDTAGLGNVDAFVAGIGATYQVSPHISLSGNYVPDNAVEISNGRRGEDFWSAAATVTFGRMLAFRAGGGKHGTIFGSLIGKFD
jgi:hypothetical protein